jgi:bifunctional aromatase (cyclase/dehydratase)
MQGGRSTLPTQQEPGAGAGGGPTGRFADPGLYTEITQFYAWQMALMDAPEPDAWADTYTVDAVFEEPGGTGVLHGREAIRESITRRSAQLVASAVVIRHWVNGLTVTSLPDGALRARYYSLAMRAPRDERPTLSAHVVCEDVLVREDGRWLVQHRAIRIDALGR